MVGDASPMCSWHEHLRNELAHTMNRGYHDYHDYQRHPAPNKKNTEKQQTTCGPSFQLEGICSSSEAVSNPKGYVPELQLQLGEKGI